MHSKRRDHWPEISLPYYKQQPQNHISCSSSHTPDQHTGDKITETIVKTLGMLIQINVANHVSRKAIATKY